MNKLEKGQVWTKEKLKQEEVVEQIIKEICLYREDKETGSLEILKVRNKVDDDTEFLETGYWTNKQIAEWFGVKPKTFIDKKSKYFSKLDNYCRFYPVKHGAYIFEVSEAFYRKNRNYEVIAEHFDETWGIANIGSEKVDTCSRVGAEICHKHRLSCKTTTAAKYTCEVRTRDYGSPKRRDGGLKGDCRYVWMVEDSKGNVREITEEENELSKALMQEVYGKVDLRDIEILIREGELDKEDVWEFIQEYDNMSEYKSVFEAFEDRTGLKLRKMTAIEARAFGIIKD